MLTSKSFFCFLGSFLLNWSIVDLQCCVNFCCTAKWFSYTQTHTYICCSVTVMSNSLWPHRLQHNKPPCPSPSLEFAQVSIHWVGDAIQLSHPLLLSCVCVCVCVCIYTHIYTHTHIYTQNILSHYGLSQNIEYSSLCSIVGPWCWSILYMLVCIW